jgi:dynein heavy chain
LGPPPLFEARLELLEPDVEFKPSLDPDVPGGFYDIIKGLMDDVFNMATLISRVASDVGQPHYLVSILSIAARDAVANRYIPQVVCTLSIGTIHGGTYLLSFKH